MAEAGIDWDMLVCKLAGEHSDTQSDLAEVGIDWDTFVWELAEEHSDTQPDFASERLAPFC